ncbi:MAG TPA: BON domain-containing protein [Actinomycetota bacterium]|nr:BON domain-containing protein [Actinomycetota bacterium]
MVDRDDLEVIRQALEDSERVDARRVELAADGDRVVLRGSVSEPEEADAVALVVERYADDVVNELRVDESLREGIVEPDDVERVVPVENEVLVGSTDMLSGPDGEITSDVARALEENEPWDPPDEPSLAPVQEEYAGATSPGGGGATELSDEGDREVPRSEYAAADLTQEELEAAARGATVPSLDPESVADPHDAQPDPAGVDQLGRTPPEGADDFPPRVPGTEPGPGATGEGTAGGGSVSGEPATETGSAGADTAAADPARATGGSMSDAGTNRGPQSREDPPLREDFPDED